MFADDLARRRDAGLYRTRRRLSSGQGVEVRLSLKDRLNFSSNDYLAYAGDPRLARAAARAAHRFGTGSGASPLVTGWLPPVRALERDLAAFEGTEAALVFPSGYQCNLAVIQALTSTADSAIFSDALNHACLIDGCRLSRAATHVYPHNDLDALRTLLKAHPAARRVIVSDGVFSMDGDTADVPSLLSLAREFDALLVIDEAHGTGVLGEHGRGASDGLSDPRLVKTGTLSKALGSQGGFVCGTASLIDFLVNHARGYIFSTAISPPAAAAARKALKLITKEPERRRQVLSLASSLRDKLRGAGWTLTPSTTPIVGVVVGDASATTTLSERLFAERLIVPGIRPPSVPDGASRLRISLSYGHTEADVDRLVAAMKKP